MKQLTLTLGATLLVASAMGPTASFASGAYSTGGARPVDETYEYGKSVYLGRAKGTEKIKYCVSVDGKPEKLKRKHLKPYKNGSTRAFAEALVDCDNPERLALTTVQPDQVPVVLYYLNKRYKLKLSDG